MTQTGAMTGEFLDVDGQELRPLDILGEGRVINQLRGTPGFFYSMLVAPCVAVVQVVELGDGPRCLWSPEWGDGRWEPVPRGQVRVLRGGMPGYFCESARDGRHDPCGSARCPLQGGSLDGDALGSTPDPGSS